MTFHNAELRAHVDELLNINLLDDGLLNDGMGTRRTPTSRKHPAEPRDYAETADDFRAAVTLSPAAR